MSFAGSKERIAAGSKSRRDQSPKGTFLGVKRLTLLYLICRLGCFAHGHAMKHARIGGWRWNDVELVVFFHVCFPRKAVPFGPMFFQIYCFYRASI